MQQNLVIVFLALISNRNLVFQSVFLVFKILSLVHALDLCFYLQLRVEGFNYIGMGSSTNKKDAQSNAARDFVNYLVRVNEMKKDEVPAFGVSCSFSLQKTNENLIAVLGIQLRFIPGVQSVTPVR